MTAQAAEVRRQANSTSTRSPRDVADVSRALRHTGRRVMLVPTMGALHDGHLALVRAAKRVPGAVVVVSIFVNPLQFGAGEDLDAYPRTLDADLDRAARRGRRDRRSPRPPPTCTPTASAPPCTRDRSAPNSKVRSRPTHFAGMLTVVLKLLQIVRPDRAFFGEKDYQQLVLVRQMVDDLNVDMRIVGRADRARTGRAGDVVAQPLPRRGGARAGRRAVGGAARRHVRRSARAPPRRWTPPARCSTRCPRSTSTTSRCATRGSVRRPAQGPGRLLVAARLGRTRLLDNIAIDIGASAGIDGHPGSSRRTITNYLGGIDVTHGRHRRRRRDPTLRGSPR